MDVHFLAASLVPRAPRLLHSRQPNASQLHLAPEEPSICSAGFQPGVNLFARIERATGNLHRCSCLLARHRHTKIVALLFRARKCEF
jgi:hypothetical protein